MIVVRDEDVLSVGTDIMSLYDDTWGEDRDIFSRKHRNKSNQSGINNLPHDSQFDNNQSQQPQIHNKNKPLPPNIVPLNNDLSGGYSETEEYKLGDFVYCTLLVKVRVEENKVKTRIFQYAMRTEKIENDEKIFSKINKQFKSSGNFIDSSDNTTSTNMYYLKNNDCKFPFIVAIKLDCDNTPKDGNIIAKFVSKRMQNTLDQLSNLKGFEYEPLLEQVVKEVRSKNMDISDITTTDNNNNSSSNKPNKRRNMKSRSKIIPMPSFQAHSSIPSYSNAPNDSDYTDNPSIGNHSPIPHNKTNSVASIQMTTHPTRNMSYVSNASHVSHPTRGSNLSYVSNASGASSVYQQPARKSPFGMKPMPSKPLPLNTPSRESTVSTTTNRSPYNSTASRSPFGSKANSSGSSSGNNNWTGVQTANQIKMSHLR